MTKSDISDLRSTLEISDRFNLSNTATAHIYNAVSTKSGVVTKEDSSEVMYQTKVGRLRKKLRIQKVQEMKEMKPVAITFDERKDMTTVVDGVGENAHKRFTLKRVENCSVVMWLENGEKEKYVDHVVPNAGTGKGLATSLIQFLQTRETNLKSLRVLLGDGTSKVTGWKGGAMA